MMHGQKNIKLWLLFIYLPTTEPGQFGQYSD